MPEMFQAGRVLVSNGGMGSRLMQLGYDIGKNKLWSAEVLLTAPDAVKQIHLEFLAASADIIITNTYQTNFTTMRARGMTQAQCEQLVDLAFQVAREAVVESPGNRRIYIGGSVGPFATHFANGAEYHGEYMKTSPPEAVEAYYREQIGAVAKRKPDILCLETIPSLKEAEIAVRVLEELKPDLPTWVAFQCRDAASTGSGDSIALAAKLVEQSPQVTLMGINCCSPGILAGAIEAAMSAGLTKGLAVYPNSGEAWFDGNFHETSQMMKPQNVMQDVLKFDAVRVVGGCCRVEPVDIEEIRKIVDRV